MLRVMVQALKLAAVLVLAVVIVIAAQRALVARLEATSQPAGTPVVFQVQQDESIDSIAERLHEAGLIRSPAYFKLRIRLSNADTRIRAGRFTLYTGMSVDQIISTLTTAPGVQVVRVRFQEGWRAEQYADELVRVGILSSPQQFLDVLQASRWRTRFPFLADVPSTATVEDSFSLTPMSFASMRHPKRSSKHSSKTSTAVCQRKIVRMLRSSAARSTRCSSSPQSSNARLLFPKNARSSRPFFTIVCVRTCRSRPIRRCSMLSVHHKIGGHLSTISPIWQPSIASTTPIAMQGSPRANL